MGVDIADVTQRIAAQTAAKERMEDELSDLSAAAYHACQVTYDSLTKAMRRNAWFKNYELDVEEPLDICYYSYAPKVRTFLSRFFNNQVVPTKALQYKKAIFLQLEEENGFDYWLAAEPDTKLLKIVVNDPAGLPYIKTLTGKYQTLSVR